MGEGQEGCWQLGRRRRQLLGEGRTRWVAHALRKAWDAALVLLLLLGTLRRLPE